MNILKASRGLWLRSANRDRPLCAFLSNRPAQVEVTTEETDNVDEEMLRSPSITRVDKINGTTICVNFSDNTQCSFNTVWLRDSCKCPQCVHPLTFGKKVNYSSLSNQTEPVSWSIKNSGVLEVVWPHKGAQQNIDQHVSVFSPDWLYQFRPLFERSQASVAECVDIKDEVYCPRTSIILWNRDTFNEDPPEVQFNKFMTERSELKETLKNVVKYGFGLMKGVPDGPEEITKIAKRMSFIREFGSGHTFEVGTPKRSKSGVSTAASNNNLNSLAYREWSPGIQLLHCIRNENTTMKQSPAKYEFVDGFAAGQWLRYHEAEAFDILTRTPITFSFLDIERDRWHRETSPIIRLDSRGHIKEVHYSILSMRPPLLPTTQMNSFYHAFKLYSKRLEDPSLHFQIDMQSGDLVIFNNRRIVQRGTPNPDQTLSDEVFLRGCYIDSDEVASHYEKMKKDDAIETDS